VAEELQSSGSTSLTVTEKVQFRPTGIPKRIVAASLLVIGATASTGAGISAQEAVRQDVLAMPRGDIFIRNDRTTSIYEISFGTTFGNQAVGPPNTVSDDLAGAVKSLRAESGLTWDQLASAEGLCTSGRAAGK
jgi:hypothetical protein